MSDYKEIGMNWGRVRVNHALSGGITPTKSMRFDRAVDLVEELGLASFEQELAPSTQDFYPDGQFVSFEEAEEVTLDLQKKLDDQVTMENIYGTAPTIERGLPPCLRVKRGEYR